MSTTLFSRNRSAGHTAEAMRGLYALVVGAGALAQNVLLTLALEGPRQIWIVDGDKWSDHNATRAPLYSDSETRHRCGNSKAATVAHELRRMTAWNPDLRISYASAWVQELGDAPFRSASVVVSCVDDPAARAYLAAMCHHHDKPMVEGGLSGSSGSFAMYANPEGPCWQCGVPVPSGVRVPAGCDANAIEQARQGFVPMTQPIAASLGSLMAEATIQVAHGQLGLSGNRVYLDDIRRPEIATIQETKNPTCSCPHHRGGRPEAQLTVGQHSSAETVLAELSQHAEEPRIILRAPYVATELCPGPIDQAAKSCGTLIDVDLCEWSLKRHPRCQQCGGDFKRSNKRTLTVLHELTANDRDWLHLPMSRFGFNGGDDLSVEDRESVEHCYRLGGDPLGFTSTRLPSTPR